MKMRSQQDEYSQAMEQAKNAGRNLWSDDEDFKKMHTRVIKQDKVSVERAIKALKNKPTSVIVEHVFDGHSLRVQLPDNHMVRMILTGVASPSIRYEEQEGKRVQVAQPYAQEALRFAESRLLHRDVIVVFDGVDKVCLPCPLSSLSLSLSHTLSLDNSSGMLTSSNYSRAH